MSSITLLTFMMPESAALTYVNPFANPIATKKALMIFLVSVMLRRWLIGGGFSLQVAFVFSFYVLGCEVGEEWKQGNE